MAGSKFVSADIEKLVQFQKDSDDVITEFNNIKKEFETINNTLLATWEGEGADAYKVVADNILEKVGSFEEVLRTINEDVVDGIVSEYSRIDDELGAFNRNPSEG